MKMSAASSATTKFESQLSSSDLPQLVVHLSPEERPTLPISTHVKHLTDLSLAELAEGDTAKPSRLSAAWVAIYNPYRGLVLLSLVVNLVLLAVSRRDYDASASVYIRERAATFALWNILVAILFRSELFLFVLHIIPCTLLPQDYTPSWIKRGVINFLLHSGGIHSGLNVAAMVWVVYNGWIFVHVLHTSWVLIWLNWMVVGWLAVIACLALPPVRFYIHDFFEAIHRFGGWSLLAILWAFLFCIYSYRGTDSEGNDLWDFSRHNLVTNTELYGVIFISFLVVLPWLLTHKVKVEVEAPSKAICILKFEGAIRAGYFGRISRSPLRDWHAFALISSDKNLNGEAPNEHLMLISALGDFTKGLIKDPPKEVYTRRFKFIGLPYLVRLYKRPFVVCTGAGISVVVPALLQGLLRHGHMLWVTKDVENTFGERFCNMVFGHPNLSVIDTAICKERPNVLELTIRMFRKGGYDCVFITSNPGLTKSLLQGLRAVGIDAYGPIFDS